MATTTATRLMTANEFGEFVNRPENAGRRWELDQGEVVEMPSPGLTHGVVCALISHRLWAFVFSRSRGFVASNDSGLLVAEDPDTVRGPDVMLFDTVGQLHQLPRAVARQVPVLVVEVLSPSDRMLKVHRRVEQYHARGVRLVWVVDFEDQSVGEFLPNTSSRLFDIGDELTGHDALPDLRVRVADLFTLPGGPPAPEAPA